MYVAGSWVLLQVVDVLAQNVGLPDWVFPFALALLAVGVPIVGITAYFHGLKSRRGHASAADAGSTRRLFTWRNTVLGGLSAAGLLGIAVAIYFVMWATGLGAVGSLTAKGVLEENDPVILAEFENDSDDAQLGSVVTNTFRVDLEQSPVLDVLPETYLSNVLRRMNRPPDAEVTSEIAREIAVREGIKAVIEGEVGSLGSGFVLMARIVNPEDGSSYASFRESAASDDELVPALDRLSRSVRERAGESLRSISRGKPLDAVTTASLSALRKYTEAMDLEERGYPGQALALLEQAVEDDSTFAMAYRKLAAIHGNRGNETERRAYATAAHRLGDRLTDVEKHLASAYYYSAIGERPQAVQEYEAVLRLDPDEATALNNLAVVYRLDGRLEEAVELLEHAVAGTGESNTAYANLVEDLLELGDVEGARRTLERFEERLPEQYWMHRARALLGISENDPSAVHAAANAMLGDEGLSEGRKRGALSYMASVDRRLGRLREAAGHYLAVADRAVALGAPESGIPWTGMAAIVFQQLGAPEAAETLRQFETALDPTQDPSSAVDLASLYWYAGSRTRLSGLVERLAPPPRQEESAAYLVARGLDLAARGDSQAVAVFRQGVTAFDCRGCLRYLEAPLLLALGQNREAAEVAESIISRPLDASWSVALQPLAHRVAGQAREALGDSTVAADHYRSFAGFWGEGDPELQPAVEAARARAQALEGLSGTGGAAPSP